MSASKWPRIQWNQANARLANAPFENLFGEQERTMNALDYVCSWRGSMDAHEQEKARAELAQLRADLHAARERSAEQARQLDAAREIMSELRGISVREQLPRINAWLAANPAPPRTGSQNGEQ